MLEKSKNIFLILNTKKWTVVKVRFIELENID